MTLGMAENEAALKHRFPLKPNAACEDPVTQRKSTASDTDEHQTINTVGQVDHQ